MKKHSLTSITLYFCIDALKNQIWEFNEYQILKLLSHLWKVTNDFFFLTEFTDNTSSPKQIQSCSIKLWMSKLVILWEDGPKNYNRINHLAQNLRLIKSIFYAQWTKIRKIKWKLGEPQCLSQAFVCFFERPPQKIWVMHLV